jgi:hypothetical protein
LSITASDESHLTFPLSPLGERVGVRGNFKYVSIGFQDNKLYSKSNGNLRKSQPVNWMPRRKERGRGNGFSPYHPISPSPIQFFWWVEDPVCGKRPVLSGVEGVSLRAEAWA